MRILRRLSFWFGARQQAEDLAAEMEDHRARLQAAFEADGFSPGEAAARSLRAMGNVTLAREDARGVWIFESLERVWHDALYALRGLRREPGFALAAMVTLALGVATTTTVFSVADSELWKPWPLPSADRLIVVSRHGADLNGSYDYISGFDLLEWQRQARAFESVGASGRYGRGVVGDVAPESVRITPVTSTYFSTLGWPVVAGRTSAPGDETGGHAALISETAWERLFNRDPAIAGRTVTLDSKPVAIVGVVKTIDGLGPGADIYPVLDPASSDFRDPRLATIANVVARLRPEVSRPAAQSEMQTIAAGIARNYPDGRTDHRIEITTLGDYYSAAFNARKLFLFLGASAVVLLLSCANVANLILARALTRRREFAIRGALGGGSVALARQLVVEGAVLSAPAGILGILLTGWSLALLRTRLPADYLFHGNNIPVDTRVAAFALALTSVTAMVFGLVPAMFARRVDLNITLGDGGRTAGRAPGHARVRLVLLTTQIAATLVLVAGAGLLLRSYGMLTHAPLGFEPEHRFGAFIGVSGPRYATDAQIRTYADAALERVRAVPGVTAAVIATSGPLESGPVVNFVVSKRPRPALGEEPRAIMRSVGPGYFHTLGIPIARGRPFTTADADGAPRVVIINQTLAQRIFPGEDPIGRVIELLPRSRTGWASRPGPVTIVGVSANAKEVDVHEVDANSLCLPFAQAPSPEPGVFAVAAGDQAGVVTAMRSALASVDPSLPARRVFPLGSLVTNSLEGARFNAELITWFAAVAMLIAAVGIYGSMSRAVRERTREFGVRLALGAGPGAILGSALRQATRVVGAGSAAGLFGVFVLARVLGTALYLVPGQHSGILYGVSMTDPLTIGFALCVLVAVGFAASAIPARHATRVDPLVVLRSD
ncbi:MAG TPA: ABC transporter permease [Vicinamibacterales bacterium]|nr:ABC transporter permease [Vicinamibacterales bacterium]